MLGKKLASDEDIIAAFKTYGSPEAVSKATGLGIRAVYRRRGFLQEKYGLDLQSFAAHQNHKRVITVIPEDRRVILHTVENGMVFIASDCHYWPGESTIAHRAFVELLKQYKPKTIVLNGDVFDGAQVSRHPPLMGVVNPTPKQEIEACQDRLHEIASASKNARKFWTFGNHDTRLFSRIAANSPELTDMVNLFDNFPGWQTCWRVDINDDVVIKHRWHNGVHATYNNTVKSGRTIVTGHLHKLQITPWSDYNGRRYGVDTGTLAEPYGDQFTYTESNPVNWCSGFAVLTFKDGMLLPPELCEVINGSAYFRGEKVI
jgi:predicted phosphodiesterase